MHECALYSDPDLYDLLFPAVRDGARVLDPARRERIAASEAFYLSKSSDRVLELGCGSGRLTIALAPKWPQYYWNGPVSFHARGCAPES